MIREGGGNAIGEGVGGNVRKRDEKPPFDKENAACRERKSRVSKNAEIRPHVAANFWRQPRADQQVGDEEEEKEYKGHNSDGPSVPENGEEPLEHEGKDYASNGAASSSEAGCGGAGGEEEVGDGGDGGSEDKGGSDAAEDGESQDKVPVFCKMSGVSNVPWRQWNGSRNLGLARN